MPSSSNVSMSSFFDLADSFSSLASQIFLARSNSLTIRFPRLFDFEARMAHSISWIRASMNDVHSFVAHLDPLERGMGNQHAIPVPGGNP